MNKETLIIVRGAGDLASGTILKLHNMGFDVVALESERPSAIRRRAAFSEAIYKGSAVVEGVTARRAENAGDAERILAMGEIPVVADPDCRTVEALRSFAVVDAILAKRNIGMRMDLAPVTIALGPGFCAGKDVHAVVETMRGAHLGKIYYSGEAIPNTGIPGKVAGYDKERVMHSPCAGVFRNKCAIGTIVEKGDVIAYVDDTPVYTGIAGVVRGMLPDGYPVTKGFKVADVDPRLEQIRNIDAVSDKARCIAGAVVEALFVLKNRMEKDVAEQPTSRKGAPDKRKLLDLLQIDPKQHRVISVVGAGGKTTLIYHLAGELKALGYRTAITTTTHIQADGRNGFQPVGVPCGDGKLTALPKEEFEALCKAHDVVLVEADGSRHHPLKVPADYEPVLPEQTDLVIGVAGTDAIGQTFAEGCHRWELAKIHFHVEPQERITRQHLEWFLSSERGQKKDVTVAYRMFMNDGSILG